MSLQLLLENAVKHNVISKSKPLKITVTAENGQLVVINKIRPKSTKLPTTKLGLKNIESRYRLVAHKEVEINSDNGSFVVKLPLLTASDQKHTYEYSDN